ncbi:hypothetical protein Pla123a_05110 [Posidoniimonas polymericola]|uniref:Leucine Rich repeats (2 copies) n=2 Tax=Posidoniimonas polymericola TaxID=2528002 RepID=A0A5C5ZEC0_9BACT|nr:hypothetical protein Pla123a_05110 [Posidoniimonas polymericola]
MTVLAVTIGLYARSVRQQRSAVEALQAIGATVQYEKRLSGLWAPEWLTSRLGVDCFVAVTGVRLSGRREERRLMPIGEPNLSLAVAAMERLPRVRRIYFADTRVTDEQLAVLGLLSGQIESLYFHERGNRGFTGAGCRHLAAWPRLRQLTLDSETLDPESLHHLTNIPALEYLAIAGTLSREDFETLSRVPNLTGLSLSGCAFDGRWLEEFSRSKHLEAITLHNIFRRFKYLGPYTAAHEPDLPAHRDSIEFKFRPGGFPNIPISPFPVLPPPDALDRAFEEWMEEHLPGVKFGVIYSS